MSSGRVVSVGPGEMLTQPSLAARMARDGDVIEIAARRYERDVAVWRANHLTIRGVGGRVRLETPGALAEGKGIWVIKGRHTTVENVEFEGARGPHRNGSGIRGEGVGLTVRHCRFHDNEAGVLAGGGPDSDILIEHSEFSLNGAGDGQSHNVYIVSARRFTLRASYVHHARVGHNVKSRARQTIIVGNRIMDETTGTSSYAIDVPNGGEAYLLGNLMHHGRRAENRVLVAYGAEGLTHPANELYVVNNTLMSEGWRRAVFVRVWGAAGTVWVLNNLLVGRGRLLKGEGRLSHNLVADRGDLVDAAGYDFRLSPGAAAIGAAVEPGVANGIDLRPSLQYVHVASAMPRSGVDRLAVGAYGYPGPGQ